MPKKNKKNPLKAALLHPDEDGELSDSTAAQRHASLSNDRIPAGHYSPSQYLQAMQSTAHPQCTASPGQHTIIVAAHAAAQQAAVTTDSATSDAAHAEQQQQQQSFADVSYCDIVKQFSLLGWTAFGGPAAHIGLFQRVCEDMEIILIVCFRHAVQHDMPSCMSQS